jgi:hypothetical protein
VATAAVVIAGAGQDPPLVTVPLPLETPEDPETPEEDEIPEEDDEVPEEDDELVPDEVPLPDAELPVDRCGRDAVICANFAPTTVAAAAASRPAVQVIFLTRRRPASLAWRARVICAWVFWDRVTE